ncbi:MAG TPA: hypothetical protein VG098_01895 [Nitrososphaera sp.]|nr:hypothetical protein [Nitrososphaera sp.]
MVEEITEKVRRLVDTLNKLELEITIVTDMMKDYYLRASRAMPEDKSYFLNGVQTGSVIKSYLLTRRGIEVPGEETVQIPDFIECVLRFANYPKRKIEVLSDLLAHLEAIHLVIQKAET